MTEEEKKKVLSPFAVTPLLTGVIKILTYNQEALSCKTVVINNGEIKLYLGENEYGDYHYPLCPLKGLGKKRGKRFAKIIAQILDCPLVEKKFAPTGYSGESSSEKTSCNN